MSVKIQEKIEKLPMQRQKEVDDFVEFLLSKEPLTSKSEPTFDWAGRPEDEPMALTSVELQHMATLWRIEQELDLK